MNDRPAETATPEQSRSPFGSEMLARALVRARGTIFWERLWPAVVALATVIGLFLAVSWLGVWLWLPPAGQTL